MARIEWKKIKIDDGDYESAGAFDIDNDGRLEIVCGQWWYSQPDWKRHKLCDVPLNGAYYDDFSTIPMDVNGDGWMDFITGGWKGRQLLWRENPGASGGEWKTHVVDECGSIETTRAWDVDGDGELEIVPNTPCAPLAFYKLVRDSEGRPAGRFTRHEVGGGEPSGHGLGFGDIDGDGRGEIIVHNGWYSPPADPLSGGWTFHPGLDLKLASVPILVCDVNGDGANELVVGNAHGFGLDYYSMDGEGGWKRHAIDPHMSQYHDLHWVDIDGDGTPELVTGSRYKAHLGKDPGETEVAGLYIFKWNGEGFFKQVVDHGLVPFASGTGIHMAIADLNGNGQLDIVAPGKDGLYVFMNEGIVG